MKRLFAVVIALLLFSCGKQKQECDTWIVTYWQGNADRITYTANYIPYDQDEDICGKGKDTVFRNKTVILSQAGTDLYNYKTFVIAR